MSDLIEKLKEVDLGNGHLSCGDARYLRNYVVHDVPRSIGATVQIVFLVESPHRDEVRSESRYPLAGHSGRNVTEDLILDHNLQESEQLCAGDRGIPIGKLVYENKIPWLAIMNVSLLPLQKKSYRNHRNQSNKIQTLWCAFWEIKEKMQRSDSGDPDLCPISRNVYDVIANNLAYRIDQITRSRQCQPKFILFGNVARRSLDRAKQIRPSLQGLPVSNIPVRHPSAWYGRKYENRCIDLVCLAFGIKDYLSRTP